MPQEVAHARLRPRPRPAVVVVRPTTTRSGGTAEAISSQLPAASVWSLRTGAVRGLLTDRPTRPPSRRAGAAGVLLAVVVAAALLWAKWLPYEGKAVALSSTHTWSGSSILATGGVHPGDAPTWHAATTFFTAYLQAIWKAL